MREIVEWIRRRDQLQVSEPLEINGEVIGSRKEYAVPEDGIGRKTPSKKRFLPLDGFLAEILRDGRDQDDEEYRRRVYAKNHPSPVPFAQCKTCGNLRSMLAYEPVGFLTSRERGVSVGYRRPSQCAIHRATYH
ncbi:MAG: hypothetical protein WBV80_10320 [Mycobacterium sp.]